MRVNKIQMAKLKLTKLDHLVTSGWVYKTGYMYNGVGVLTSQHIPSYPPFPSLDLNILLVNTLAAFYDNSIALNRPRFY
mgnify:CR=1 FL=1